MRINSELAQQGMELAAELEVLRGRYDVRSDAIDVLYYKALALRAKSRDLMENCGLKEEQADSALLSAWGLPVAATLPEISKRASRFQVEYDESRNK